EKVCHQVGVIREGRLLAVGNPEELKARTGAPRAQILGRGFDERVLGLLRARPEVAGAQLQDGQLWLELRGEVEMAPLVSLLVSAGAQVEEVRKGKASLEEVFLTLMEEEK
ncbi:MAG: DUF4162 domain-containing protein, partial [Anaerolineae bacterium]|nr:DUF4162 domain-containing protein [Anaerolineae bacterium]